MLTIKTKPDAAPPKYVRWVANRHGNFRLQFQRRNGDPIHWFDLDRCFVDSKFTPDFHHEYHMRMAGNVQRTVASGRIDRHANSVGALAAAYFSSTDFVRCDPKTKRDLRRLIENCLRVQPKGWECPLGDLHHSNPKEPLRKWHAEAVLA